MLPDNYCVSHKIISVTPGRFLKTESFEKRGNLSSEEKILAFFSRSIEHDKCQATIYKGPQGVLTNIVHMIRPFLWDLRGR